MLRDVKTKKILSLMGAFTFAFFIGTIVHEYGHVIALKAFGVDQYKVIIHPFKGNQIIWDVNNNFIGYVDAAGPLLNIIVGNSILISLWRWRKKMIPSLLLWGPVALIQEGFNALIQVTLNIPGTDAVRLVTAGIPPSVLQGIALLLFIAGVVLLTLQLPMYGVSHLDSYLSKITTLVPGFVGYMAVIFIYNIVFYPPGVTRGIILAVFSALIAILVSFIYGPIVKHLGTRVSSEVVSIEWTSVLVILGLAVVTLVLGLMLNN